MTLVVLMFLVGVGLVVGGYAAVTSLPAMLEERRLARRLQDVSLPFDSLDPASGSSLVMKSPEGPLPGIDRLVARTSAGNWLATLIDQSGVKTTPSAIVSISVVLALLVGGVTAMLTKPVFGALAGGVAVMLPVAFLLQRRGSRLRTFEEFFPEALDLMARALRADELPAIGLKAGLPSAAGASVPGAAAGPSSPPVLPEDSLSRLHLRPGFKAELVAAEPLLESPVAIDWDERDLGAADVLSAIERIGYRAHPFRAERAETEGEPGPNDTGVVSDYPPEPDLSQDGVGVNPGGAAGVAVKPRLSLVDRVEQWIARLSSRSNFWHRVCSMVWLPYAFRSGIRMKRLDDTTFAAELPFRRFNRNWYNAMAGAALLVFTLSMDEFLITFFVSGQKGTLTMHIWSLLKDGIAPRVNALASVLLAGSFVLLLSAAWLRERGAGLRSARSQMS